MFKSVSISDGARRGHQFVPGLCRKGPELANARMDRQAIARSPIDSIAVTGDRPSFIRKNDKKPIRSIFAG